MAGTNEQEDSAKAQVMECDSLFVWDDELKLYFHASTGFYHDPNDGWYYSSRDGLYYTFENGTYVPVTYTEEEKSAACKCTGSVSSEPTQLDSGIPQHFPSDETNNELPASQWIEETLIDLYLSGYKNAKVNSDSLLSPLSNEQEGCQVQCEGLTDYLGLVGPYVGQNGTENHQNDESNSDCVQNMDELTDIISSKEEENWHAQYGQVTRVADDDLPPFSVVDLWNWEMIMESIKNNHVTRLIGRVTKRSSKLHPSIPASDGLVKTAAIQDVHLDFVRDASGRVYRLRSPSIKYLVSLSTYDSSNPTKDWDFPDFLAPNYEYTPVSHDQWVDYASSSTSIDELPSMAKKKTGSDYRDRAAERRALHGGFGTGSGQKSFLDDNCISGESQTPETDGVLNEAINASFGPGSYARKILEGMGWKHGESLGSSNKGILEPLCPAGNKGCAGLGWNQAHCEN